MLAVLVGTEKTAAELSIVLRKSLSVTFHGNKRAIRYFYGINGMNEWLGTVG